MSDMADRIHAYMQFRAAREGVEHDLPVTFYQEAIDNGCVGVFGVETEAGVLLADEQRPDLFLEWLCSLKDQRDE